jgi:choice-of-anchor B domain-containing protein
LTVEIAMCARRCGFVLALLAAFAVALGSPAAARAQTSFECVNGMAGPYPCNNVDLASFVPMPLLGVGTGNDVWGWKDPKTGREYALMGTSTTTAFVDVTDPENPALVGRLPTRGIPDFILWRDIKVDGNYAFIVSELTNSGLQVFDLRRLRHGTPTTVFTSDATYDDFSFAHNIAVNEQTNYAYVVGSDTCGNGEENGGLHMVDISDPLNPEFAGCALVEDADGNDATESNNYVHDAECVIYRGPDRNYRGREICFGSNENVVAIYDVTDKSDPRVISLRGYPQASYTHQGWLTPDQRWFLFGDELDEQEGQVEGTTTYIMQAADLDNPRLPLPFTQETTAIDHNLYIYGPHVYESNYSAGLRIFEWNRSLLLHGMLREIAFFDVFPAGDPTEFVGTWSNYRFPSGTTVVSVIENQVSGLFVLQPRLG